MDTLNHNTTNWTFKNANKMVWNFYCIHCFNVTHFAHSCYFCTIKTDHRSNYHRFEFMFHYSSPYLGIMIAFSISSFDMAVLQRGHSSSSLPSSHWDRTAQPGHRYQSSISSPSNLSTILLPIYSTIWIMPI